MGGIIIPEYSRNWLESPNEEQFRKGLAELNLERSLIDEATTYYSRTRRVHISNKFVKRHFYGPDGQADADWADYVRRSESGWDALRKFLGMRTFVVEKRSTRTAEIPIFILGSPAVIGSKVTYRESTSEEAKGTWGIKVFGTGMGATTSFKVQHSASFEASGGAAKLIFVPVKINVSLVAVYQGEKFLSRGLRSEMKVPNDVQPFDKGVRLLSPQLLALRRPRPQTEGQAFRLLKDISGDKSTYAGEWEDSLEVEAELGLEVFGLALSTKIRVTQTRKISLEYELPGGFDYRLRPLADAHGLWWDAESGPE